MSDHHIADGHECADDDGEKIPVCPECDSPTIGTRVGASSRAPEYDWRCQDCYACFDAARWRTRKRDWTTRPAEQILRCAGVEDPEAVIDYNGAPDDSGGQADE